MDPILNAIITAWGPTGALVCVIVYLHWTQVRDCRAERAEMMVAFREEMACEREQHDRHVTALLNRMDALASR